MENPTEPYTNNTMSENDRSDVAVLENMEEKNHSDETELLQKRKRGPQMKAPSSNKREKGSEKMRVSQETREFQRSSQSLFIKNLSSNDLEGEPPSLDHGEPPILQRYEEQPKIREIVKCSRKPETEGREGTVEAGFGNIAVGWEGKRRDDGLNHEDYLDDWKSGGVPFLQAL
uniref:Uncharacterized protein n=1 Tax=Cucumis melo TaxID=3656 RepID=A0A9I9EJA8_CUCME